MRKKGTKQKSCYKKVLHTGVLRYIKHALSRDKIGETLVLKGYISPKDLKKALNYQKSTKKPLGQILIEQSKITKYDLLGILCRQHLIRITAATIMCFVSLGGFAKKAQANNLEDVPARIVITSVDLKGAFDKITKYPELFGATEKKSTNLKAFTKWSEMFERFSNSLNTVSAQKIIKNLQNELINFQSVSIYDMADDVNKMMNKKKYILDKNNWGQSDFWATPIEFIKRGGDCEDFAIAKYAALRALGVPEERMRIAIVQDQRKNMPHAVLVVYSEKGPVILDNQIKTMKRANEITHYKPIFSINREAWWLHTPKDSPSTIVASAN